MSGTGDDVLIGGFIVGSPTARVIVRAIGPSLRAAGVNDALSNPTLELRDNQGELVLANNDWEESQRQEIVDTGVAPMDPTESAIVASLAAGNYTAIVTGAAESTGIAVVELYDITPP